MLMAFTLYKYNFNIHIYHSKPAYSFIVIKISLWMDLRGWQSRNTVEDWRTRYQRVRAEYSELQDDYSGFRRVSNRQTSELDAGARLAPHLLTKF